MEGFEGQPPPALLPRYWAPRWDSVQALNKFQEEVGGPLRGDEPGRLLFAEAPREPAAGGGPPGTPAAGGEPAARAEPLADGGPPGVPVAPAEPLAGLTVPPAFAPVTDEWLVVALHHALGSEELSALGPAIQQRTPVPYVALGEEDAAVLLGGAEGAVVRLEWGGYRRRLPLRVVPGLPRGIAGLPAGLPGLAGLLPPFRARLVVEAPPRPDDSVDSTAVARDAATRPARPPQGGAA
jgi:NADH-quinone oxidoreductase subunit G